MCTCEYVVLSEHVHVSEVCTCTCVYVVLSEHVHASEVCTCTCVYVVLSEHVHASLCTLNSSEQQGTQPHIYGSLFWEVESIVS